MAIKIIVYVIKANSTVFYLPSISNACPGLKLCFTFSQSPCCRLLATAAYQDVWAVLVLRMTANKNIAQYSIFQVSQYRVPPGPYKSLKVLKFHTFKYKALKSP